MKTIGLMMLLWCAPAWGAGPYLELGLGYATGTYVAERAPAKVGPDTEAEAPTYDPVAGPFARVEVGYTFATWRGETAITASHLSSLSTGRDEGVNFVGLSHRFGR